MTELCANNVAPSKIQYAVTFTHGHKNLCVGDVVMLVETPKFNNVLLRLSDNTLHDLQGQSEQYVHLKPI